MFEPFILPCARPKFEVQTTSCRLRVQPHLRTLQYFINAKRGVRLSDGHLARIPHGAV